VQPEWYRDGLFADQRNGRNLAVRKPSGGGGAGSQNRLTEATAPFRRLCVSLGRLLR
jgi:hypothetical protein